MHHSARLLVILGSLALAACGQESDVRDTHQGTPGAGERLYVQATGMVKALGIT